MGGRASVGGPEAGPAYGGGGRAAVARAAVRPVSPAVGGPDGPEGPEHGKRGSAGKILNKSAKRRRRTNILTAAAAVLVILLGGGVVGGTYFFDSVSFEEPAAESQTTQLLASDKKTVLASLGQFNRSIVPDASINPLIKLAVVSAEDKGFYKHNGIDMKGIARAAWNNFTGGDTQGASTITQQYAKYATKRKEITYNVKLREAVIARKMEDEYSKDQILGRYLNSVYFGRGAYGIEAAVKAYFGPSRSALTPPGQKGAITAGEAAILASVIKQPEPTATHRGYDPQKSLPDATERWNYTVGNMRELGLPAGNADAGVPAGIAPPTAYPTSWKKFNPEKCLTCNNNTPSAKIVKYVKRELRDMGITDARQNQGGLQILTTIDPKVQEAAEKAANRAKKSSPLHDMAETYKSALVSIDPDNGRVLAYYGGPDAASWDYAGPNYDDTGQKFLGGGRPPGSTFKIYTLIAALSAGYGMDTIWDSTLKKVDGGGKISNSGREGGSLQCPEKACDLETSVEQSYNFTFYWLADALGPEKVIEQAHKAGIQLIGDPETTARYDLNKLSESDLKEKNYGREVGFGQYAITALDHASGVATIANNGVYNKAHFVQRVSERDPKTGKFTAIKGKGEKLKGVEAFTPDVAAAVQNVMQKIPGINGISLDNGRKAIGKTGTWEFTGKGGKSGDNGDAWMVGGTKHLATSVWVGREKVNKKTKQMDLLPIYKPGGKPMNGGSVPGQIWKQFMDAASKAIDAKNDDFLPNSTAFVDPSKQGNGVKPPPPPPEPENPACQGIPLLCQDNGGNGNGDNGGNGNGGNGNGNGNGNGDNGQEQGTPGTFPTFPGGDAGNDTGTGGGENDGDNADDGG
ncbi:transglycosylase domain-containing protein [Actinoplanes friuliensis]|uniref:transglycosylase domain-containing protein n=1 Tax=Actinoplanes friuliensis TaxID=196914 RepID=UPI000694ABD8|nr:transglycosylase domain-containing protein [Actinoplanes friuliensis]